ncbi:hypothetical protein H9P43_001838 [Blastocladiella emersonii ATCC 22665]|nr:hypothetical protein H9P43_001838 [Blastocladiella emersonii ATCC 22665]
MSTTAAASARPQFPGRSRSPLRASATVDRVKPPAANRRPRTAGFGESGPSSALAAAPPTASPRKAMAAPVQPPQSPFKSLTKRSARSPSPPIRRPQDVLTNAAMRRAVSPEPRLVHHRTQTDGTGTGAPDFSHVSARVDTGLRPASPPPQSNRPSFVDALGSVDVSPVRAGANPHARTSTASTSFQVDVGDMSFVPGADTSKFDVNEFLGETPAARAPAHAARTTARTVSVNAPSERGPPTASAAAAPVARPASVVHVASVRTTASVNAPATTTTATPARNSGTGTPPFERMRRNMGETKGMIIESEKLTSEIVEFSGTAFAASNASSSATPFRSYNTVVVTENRSEADRALKGVLEMLETALDLTLVGPDNVVNLDEVERRIGMWKKRNDTDRRALSLADRADPPKSPPQQHRELLEVRQEMVKYRKMVEDLQLELKAAKHDATRRKSLAETNLTALRAELSQLKATNAQLAAAEDAKTTALWKDMDEKDAAIAELRDTIKTQLRTIATAQTETERLAGELAETQAARARADDQLKQEREQVRVLTADKQKLESDLMVIQDQVNQQIEKLRFAQERTAASTATARDVHAAQIRADELQAQLDEAKRVHRVTLDELASARRDVDHVQHQLADANRREDELRAKLRESEAARAALAAEAAEAKTKMQNTTAQARKGSEDLLATRKLLESHEHQLKEHAEKYQRVFAEKEQLALVRRDLELRLNRVQTELENALKAQRSTERQLDELRVRYNAMQEAQVELKRRNDVLFAHKKQTERQREEAESKEANTSVTLRNTSDELKLTRKELETAVNQRCALEERINKLQEKIQAMATRADDAKRELARTKEVSEERASKLDTLELQWKQVLADNRSLEHKLQSLETRIREKQGDLDRVTKKAALDAETYQTKLASAVKNVQELDRQLTEAKTRVQLTSDERTRLIADNKKFLARIEKYQAARAKFDDKLAHITEERDKYERRTRELHKYKALYTNVLEAGLIVDRAQPLRASVGAAAAANSSNAIDWDVLTEHHQLLTRCRRIVQSAARFTSLAGSESLSAENLTTTEDLLEALEVVISSLCQQAARGAARDPAASASTRDARWARSSAHDTAAAAAPDSAAWRAVAQLQAHILETANALRGVFHDLVDRRLMDEELLSDLDLAAAALREARDPTSPRSPSPTRGRDSGTSADSFLFRRNSNASATSTTATTPAVVQACAAVQRVLQRVVPSISEMLMSKVKDVVAQVQDKTEHELRDLKRKLATLNDDNTRYKDQLTRTMMLNERMAELRKHKKVCKCPCTCGKNDGGSGGGATDALAAAAATVFKLIENPSGLELPSSVEQLVVDATLVHPTTGHALSTLQRRDLDGTSAYRDHALVKLSGVGSDGLTIQLKRNKELISPGYQHIYSGGEVKGAANGRVDCLFHGHVLGQLGSVVAVSACDGLHGLIQVNSTFRYSIHALEHDMTNATNATGLARRHVLLRESASSSESPNSDSEHFCPNTDPGFPASAPRRTRLQKRDPAELSLIGSTSFHSSALEMTQLVRRQIASTANLRVELMIANDYQRYQIFGNDTELSALEIVNVAAALYLRSNLIADPYRIVVTVAGQYTATTPMWVAGSTTTVDVTTLLSEFCSWRRSQASATANAGTFLAYNDLGHLLTARTLTASGVTAAIEGYGYTGGMCNAANSCAVIHAQRVVDLAYQGTVMAHEMGHNFGAGHDSVNNNCPNYGFIMQPSTCSACGTLPNQFSSCSDTAITSFLINVDTSCLDNAPALCGNGVVDPGEQCDSGNPLTGSSCCTARCRLRTGAVCDDKNGKCCRNCQFVAAGTICRQRATDAVRQLCDVQDTCTGNSFVCTDRTVANGASCFLDAPTNAAAGTCNRGFCQSRASVCSIYGYGYSPSCDPGAGSSACTLYCQNGNRQCVNLSYTSSLVVVAPDYASCPYTSGRYRDAHAHTDPYAEFFIDSDAYSDAYTYSNADAYFHHDADADHEFNYRVAFPIEYEYDYSNHGSGTKYVKFNLLVYKLDHQRFLHYGHDKHHLIVVIERESKPYEHRVD